MEHRLDIGRIQNYRETPEGFLDLNISFSKVGELTYRRTDGSLETEYLTEEELFNEDSITTATGKPLTWNHPPRWVTKNNVREYQRGATGTKIIKDSPFATIVATVHDAELIDVIKSGKAKEVSAGYTTKVVKKDGKLYQTQRQYNHFAVVERGRAGPEVRVHFDGADEVACQVTDADDQPIHSSVAKETTMPTQIPIGKRIFAVDGADAPKLADEVAALQTKLDEISSKTSELETKLQAATSRADSAEKDKSRLDGEVEGLKTKLTQAENTRTDADGIATEVQARLDAWSEVLPALQKDNADFQPDYKLDVASIRKLYLLSAAPHLKERLAKADAQFIEGLWEGLKPEADDRRDSTDDLMDLLNQSRQDSRERVSKGDMREKERELTQRRKNRSLSTTAK